jgi:2-oxoglutarate dehydrogenase E2 component (dihydrolipoamide succinyltransferase)
MKEDVLRTLAERPAEAEAPVAPEDEVQPLNRIRRATAKALATSWVTAPHVFQAVEVPFHRVDAARKALNAAAGPRDVKLSYLPFVARAVCLALREFPRVNAQLDGERLIVKGRVNLAIAVDLGHEGLVVPVVHDADELTLRGLARRIDEAVAKARENRLSSDDLEGGTYTISNNGSFGTLMTAPIINPPQVAILSTDAIRKKPVVVETEDGDAVVVRRVGVLGQSFDHRAFDGAYAAAYLHRAGEILATRDWAAEGS